jgi:hypothetical protein
MANKRISALPEKLNPSENDLIPIVDTQNPNSLSTKRTTIGALLEMAGGGTGVGNIDGGRPDTQYGGLAPLDGGGV